MKAEDLIVSAECVETGERLIGYVCCCEWCRRKIPGHKYDETRSIGRLTTPDGYCGGIEVYIDNMEFVR